MITFDQVKQAFKVFAGDYSIVGHSELTPVAPWEEPHQGHYSLTQLPDTASEADVDIHLAEADTIVVSCMDKDMVHEAWRMESFEGIKKVWMVSMAGGVVQADGERYEAMRTIATWLFEKAQAGKMPQLSRVMVMDHNHTCGAVKYWSQGEPLVELIKRLTGKEAKVREYEENTVMIALIRKGAEVWNQFQSISGMMYAMGLFDTQRNGEGSPSRIKPVAGNGVAMSVGELQDPEKIKQVLG